MEDFFVSVGKYCFPMVVIAFLLVRIEGRLTALDQSIQLLTRTIERRSP